MFSPIVLLAATAFFLYYVLDNLQSRTADSVSP